MGFDGSWWVLMRLNGSWWIPMDPDRSRWISMGPDGFQWILMGPNGSRCILMDSVGSRWVPMDPDGSWWIPMGPYGYTISPFGVSPKWVKSRSRKKKKKDKKVSENNGQLRLVRHYGWRTQAAWTKKFNLGKFTPILGFSSNRLISNFISLCLSAWVISLLLKESLK